MSLFGNLKVTQRLYLIYGIVILCSIGMYVMVQYFVTQSGRHTENVFTQEVSAQMLTLEISGEMNMVSRLSRNIMLGTDLDKDLGGSGNGGS